MLMSTVVAQFCTRWIMTKIICPKCHRILGDTRDSINCNLNCKWCKKAVPIRIKVAKTTDYFKRKEEDD